MLHESAGLVVMAKLSNLQPSLNNNFLDKEEQLKNETKIVLVCFFHLFIFYN